MSKAKSSEEKMIPAAKEMQAKGSPEKKIPSVKDTLPGGMKAPKDSGEKRMGGVHKGSDAEANHMGHAGMGHAIRHLERETERGAHCPTVAGHDAGMHSGRASKE